MSIYYRQSIEFIRCEIQELQMRRVRGWAGGV